MYTHKPGRVKEQYVKILWAVINVAWHLHV